MGIQITIVCENCAHRNILTSRKEDETAESVIQQRILESRIEMHAPNGSEGSESTDEMVEASAEAHVARSQRPLSLMRSHAVH